MAIEFEFGNPFVAVPSVVVAAAFVVVVTVVDPFASTVVDPWAFLDFVAFELVAVAAVVVEVANYASALQHQ